MIRVIQIGNDKSGSVLIDKSITRVTSGYVSGIPIPTAKDYHPERTEIHVKKGKLRTVQRFISGKEFNNIAVVRHDCVILQAPNVENSSSLNLWFGRVLALIKIPGEDKTSPEREMVFVQFFDICPLEDEVDKALGCIKLKWATGETEEDQGNQTAEKERKWFTLLPIGTIHAVTHVIRGDYGIKNRGLGVDMEEVDWNEQTFYVNRFYFDPESEYFKC